RTTDGSLSRHDADTGRGLPLCWAVAVAPRAPESLYVSAASGPRAAHSGRDARGRRYCWSQGAWQAVPLPDDTMPYALAAGDDELIAGMADGRIFHSSDRGQRWTDTGVETGSVMALAAG